MLGSLSAQQFTDVKATAFPSQTPSASLGNPIWGDIDGDGDLDLIVPTASTAPAIYLNDNDGADHFTVDTTSGIGPQPNSSDGWKGFALGDYDEDGDLDLFIAADEGRRSGESLSSNIFFINNGSGTFSHSTDTALLDPMAHGKSGFWVDYNNNGHLKLFVKNYGTANLLYKLRTSGDFVSISGADGLDIATSFGPNDNYHGNNCAFQDYDNDGDMDVVFSHDRTQLWRNDAPGGYTIMADTLVTPTSEKGKGVAWGDYDNDGYPDLFVARGAIQGASFGTSLYHNNHNGTFTDVASSAGVYTTANTWSAVWGDYDNDGYLDLFVTCAGDNNSIPPGNGNHNFLFHNLGNDTFTDMADSAGVQLETDDGTQRHKAAAWADYNDDGFLDLVVKDGFGITHLLKNNITPAPNNHFIKVILQARTQSPHSNPRGIGARVKVFYSGGVGYRQQTGGDGGNFESQGSQPLHFGIGSAPEANVQVKWPSGVIDLVPSVAANSTLTVAEGSSP